MRRLPSVQAGPVSTPRLTLTRPLCVLWRLTGDLQLGLDAEGAVLLPDAPPGTDAALRALRTPRTPLEVARLVPLIPRASLDRMLTTLLDAGLLTPEPPGHPAAVTVLGTGPLAAALADLLSLEGTDIRTGLRAVPDDGGLVIVCGSRVEPDRVLTRNLSATGLPHLVVRIEPERAVVGPFVVPGRTSCVTCTDLVRREVDPDWPHLLAQLCRSEHVPRPRQAAWAAAMASAQIAAWRSGETPDSAGATLELDAHTGTLGRRRWPRHPDCGCHLGAG